MAEDNDKKEKREEQISTEVRVSILEKPKPHIEKINIFNNFRILPFG